MCSWTRAQNKGERVHPYSAAMLPVWTVMLFTLKPLIQPCSFLAVSCKSLDPLLSVPEIFKVCGDTEVAIAHELNDSLQVVFLFACDANLPVLLLALDFESL